ALDAELRFKAEARRNKLLGLWVAERLGKKDAEAEAYAREVVAADFEEAGDEDVFRKVRADLDAAGVSATDEAIREKMFAFMEEAIRQVKQD
ncbi:ATPase inhibitor subunit zeta, partial [Brucella sp. BO2]